MDAAQETKTLPSPPYKLPAVTIIIQEPCIAVRFPLQYGQVVPFLTIPRCCAEALTSVQIRRFQMKFKLGSDFYKALALLSQAGCPFTQAGSPAVQGQAHRPFTASSAVAPTGLTLQPRENFGPAQIAVDPDQKPLVPSLGAPVHPSSRPSTSSSSTWKSEPDSSAYSKPAQTRSSGGACPGRNLVSPFYSGSKHTHILPDFVSHQHEKRSRFPHEVASEHYWPSSDPIAGTEFSSDHNPPRPNCAPIATRPSTAPSFQSPRLSQMLPPRRELPFKVSGITTNTSKMSVKDDQAPSDMKAGRSDAAAETSLTSVRPVRQQTSSVASEISETHPVKRATKAKRVTKGDTAAPRSRKKPSTLKDESPVPSVEELLRRSQRLSNKKSGNHFAGIDAAEDSVPSASSAVSHLEHESVSEVATEEPIANEQDAEQPSEPLITYPCSNIDTQSLLARVEKHQQQQNAKRKTVINIQEESLLHPSKRLNMDAGLDQAAAKFVSDGEQIHMGGLQEAPAEMSKTSDSSSPGISSMDIGSLRPPERRPLADISNSNRPGPSYTPPRSSIMALMNDPDFARSPGTAKWADLPPEERDAALETWMCEQLDSESFMTLMKTLEGMWQRVFFGQ
jgi:hypothetical protein